MTKIYVIGIGFRPLDKRAREAVLNSEVLLASDRLYHVFKWYEEFENVKDRIKVLGTADETIGFIKSFIAAPQSLTPNPRLITLLAAGDPMFFGIGRKAVKEFGTEMVEILPDLSSVQVAFSRIKEPWDNAFLMSLHGGPDPQKRRRMEYELKDIPELIQKHEKIAILADKENTPSMIADSLLKTPALPRFSPSAPVFYVCEKLGYPDERIVEGTAEEIAGMSFSDPNVVIILRR